MEEIANETSVNNETVVTEDLATQYDKIIEALQQAKANETPIEEGVIGGILGTVGGAVFGPSVMKAICNALGVDERGTFGSLLTSRAILTIVGAKLGWKM